MKHFAAVDYGHKTLRQSPGGLTYLGTGMRRKSIECCCEDGGGSKRSGDGDTY